MIDATRSPRPLWRRILNLGILVAGTAVAAWVIWVKELHHTTVHVHAFSVLVLSSLGSSPFGLH